MTTKQKFKGAVHVHSDLSHDGQLSFDQLTSFLRAKGYDFVTITEHSYDVNQEVMDQLAEKAQRASTDGFLIIPGLEFRCYEDVDILGLGVYQTIDSEDMATVIDHIHTHNGVAIFAHPGQREEYPIESSWVTKLDGLELYNLKAGKLLPQLPDIRLCRMMRGWRPELNIHFGLDLHTTRGFMHLSNTVWAAGNDTNAILTALKVGKFTNESVMFNVGSDGQMGPFYIAYVYLLRILLNMVRWLRGLLHI